MNKSLIIASLLALAAISFVYVQKANKVDLFEQWKVDFGRPFNLAEQAYRRIIFERNVKRIEQHNADSTQTYKKGINQFTIYTDEEFKLMFLSEMTIPSDTLIVQEENYQGPNAEIDWTTKGGVSRIKNQGQCGSCWAFSATGVAESFALVQKKQRVDLSQQQLVDCSGSYGNHGCNGGWPANALKYVKDHGLSSESEYPYTAKGGSCRKTGGSFHISSIGTAGGCSGMESKITAEPLSVTVDASNWSSYRSGVLNNCGKSINHAVLLVGTVGGAWKIKNSWGTSWGQGGFIRLAGGNTCGVCNNGGVYVA